MNEVRGRRSFTVKWMTALVRVVALNLAVSGFGAEGEWKVGLADVKITPERPVMLAGYAARTRPFDRVEDDLFAKAIAFEDARGNRGVMVTSDLIGFPADVGDPIAAAVMAKTGLRREQLVLNSSHTHTGPILGFDENRRGSFSPEAAKATVAYTRQLQEKIVSIVERALADLAPARLSWGVGVAHFAMNRREFTTRGVRLGVNPRGLVDRSVPVLKIEAPDGKLRGVLFGYACHNTTFSQTDYFVAGDYAGQAQRVIEAKLGGAKALFMLGVAGDANPYPRGAADVARQHGEALGKEVLRVLETKLTPVRGPLACVLEKVDLPIRPLARPELEKMKATGNVREKATAEKLLGEIERGVPQPTRYAAPVAAWQFGSDLTWVGLSGEVVVDFVPLIEQAVGPLQLWVSAYCNDVYGYLPSARVIAEGGYEARGLFAVNGIFTPEAEPTLVNKVRELAMKAGRK